MKVVIIEDERLTAQDLQDILLHINPGIEIDALLTSVKESLHYFENNDMPDLIFSDIQLGDGLSFDIFQQLRIMAPIIFCTAYNQYAMNAFETSGIHYILKPFDEKAIREALKKYENLKSSFEPNQNLIDELQNILNRRPSSQKSSILVYDKDRIIPVSLTDIALFYIHRGVTHLYTFQKEIYFVNKTLEEVQQLGDDLFYRVNRQFVINRKAIQSVSQRLSRKASLLLNVPFEEAITVSKEKITDLLEWLEGK